MPTFSAKIRLAAGLMMSLMTGAALLLAAATGMAQTAPQAPQTGNPSGPAADNTYEMPLKTDKNDLYILKDVQKPDPAEPKLDLGKVGKKGKLSLEPMRIGDEDPPDTRPRGGGGLRLRVPLGKQAP